MQNMSKIKEIYYSEMAIPAQVNEKDYAITEKEINKLVAFVEKNIDKEVARQRKQDGDQKRFVVLMRDTTNLTIKYKNAIQKIKPILEQKYQDVGWKKIACKASDDGHGGMLINVTLQK